MRSAKSRMNRRRAFVRGILFYAVVGLLTLTMLSTWLVCGMYAKYTTAGSDLDSARVAKGLQLQLLEHEVEYDEKEGEYTLNNNEVPKNTYPKVIPGVDIPKDPFVRLSGTSEVDYWLYVQITEKNFPEDDAHGKTVTYEVTGDWDPVPGQPGVYKYKTILDSKNYGNGVEIPILKNNELTVSQYYKGSGDFSLTFKAWIVQAD